MDRWIARGLFVPTLLWNVALGRLLRTRAWWSRIDEHLILGALPFPHDAAKLKREGVTGVVNMCEEYSGPQTRYVALGIEQLRLPTVDFRHPSREFTEKGAEFIQRHAQAGGTVYVHCKAGRARSATIVLWWLVKYRGLTAEAAQQRMLAARPHVNPKIYLRPVIQELIRDVK